MARRPFEPIGKVPEWRLIYDQLLAQAEFGDEITYAMLDDALGRPFLNARWPFYRARIELGALRHRWAESVPGVGYRIIAANEHMHAAQARKQRARRQLSMMVRIGQATDLSRLTGDELARHDAQARVNLAVYRVLTEHEDRLNRVEEILRADGKL